MNMRAVLTLTIGVALAGAAVFAVHERLQNGEPAADVQTKSAPFETRQILVATNPLGFGSRIEKAHVKLAVWPAESVPAGSFSTTEELFGDGTEDRLVLKPLEIGEPLLKTKVSGFGARASMSTVVDETNRAFTIRVNEVTGVAGFLLPGDRVDVLLTRRPDQAAAPVTHVILQNIVVRGTDQNADQTRDKPKVSRAVTVEVTPEEAQKLALAMKVGELSLALRNAASAEEADVRMVSVADLIGEQKGEKASRRVATVRVRGPSSLETISIR